MDFFQQTPLRDGGRRGGRVGRSFPQAARSPALFIWVRSDCRPHWRVCLTIGEKRSAAQRSVVDAAASRVLRAWAESPFYEARLKGPAPDRILVQPNDPRTPDPSLGEAVLRGKFSVGSATVDCEGDLAAIWDVSAKAPAARRFLQEFSWLRHAGAVRAPEERARAIAAGWLARHDKWSPDAWEPALVAERLINLCCHASLLLKGADALWRSRILSSMARQTRHLANTGHRAAADYGRLTAALGLTLAAVSLPGCEAASERGMELLRRELRLQIRPDGGYASRNPSLQLDIVIRLQMIVAALEARRLAVPPFLKHALARTAVNLQVFRSGDGGLAVFNGGYEDDARAVLAALQALDADAPPSGFARHTGFHRIESARTLLIADAGAADCERLFESVGSFHFSSGRSRIVVNCGNGARVSAEWSAALSQAAAHSALSAEFPSGVAPLPSAAAVAHRRSEDARGQLVQIDRAFGDRAGPRHVRRLYLAAAGDNLRGEDSLLAPPTALAAGWRLRFHLHPSVKASTARDGKSVILALSNSEGWRFRANAPALRLERSVYCGAGGAPLASEQIVLGPFDLEEPVEGDMVVKWAFQRLEERGPAEF
jgi:uncharacterized heparinase superfamily protein